MTSRRRRASFGGEVALHDLLILLLILLGALDGGIAGSQLGRPFGMLVDASLASVRPSSRY